MSETVLPFDVRYAMSYREAHLTTDEVSSLYRNFGELGLYLTLKSMHGNTDGQSELLEQVVSRNFDLTGITHPGSEHPTVDGKKIAAFSRYGENTTREAFISDANKRRELIRQPGNSLVLMAYGMYAGLRPYVEVLSESEGSFVVVSDESVLDGDDLVGVKFQNGRGRVEIEPFSISEEWPNEVTVVDDTINSGDTFKAFRTGFINRVGNVNLDLQAVFANAN